MESNRYSTGPPVGPPDELVLLAAAADRLAAMDLDRLSDVVRAERVLILRRLLDRLDGQWLKELAAADARGAAGADQDQQVGSTAAWLRGRLRLGAGAATGAVRTARALFRGPLTQTAAALTDGAISVAHASVLAHGTRDLPDHLAAEAEPVLVEAAARLDPPRLRRVIGHLRMVADPDGADAHAERRHQRRGLWLTPTFDGMVAIDGLVEPEAGQMVPGRPGTIGPPHRRQRPSQRQPTHRRRPHRAGPPQLGGRPVAPDRWGPAPAERGRRPAQPARPPWEPGRRAGLGRPHRPRSLPAAGLRRRGEPRHRQPPHHERRQPQRDRRPGGAAAGGQGQVASDPGWGSQPALGRRAQQPSRPARPASGTGCAGRRLCLS